jgi:hypothetical protein
LHRLLACEVHLNRRRVCVGCEQTARDKAVCARAQNHPFNRAGQGRVLINRVARVRRV